MKLPDQRWYIASPNPEKVKTLAEETGLSPLLAQVILNRGIDSPNLAQVYINPDLESLPDPLDEFPDLLPSIELLKEAIETGEKIAICGDYDADGMTSTALLLRAFNYLGGDAYYEIPSRMKDGYGINKRIVEKFAEEGVGLVLTVDNGIAAYNPIERAIELGLTVIITDHHDLPEKLPPADAILNPKLLSINSPYRGLAGVGVAYILAVTLAQEFNKKEEISKFNTLAYWYNHNALIHYQSPHGLEQYGGAAWGTRDVCQGPFEYFLATQHFEVCKDILKRVYVHQFIDNGDWPQWFMFDKYNQIQASESHGDVIVWPLRSLALYLKATHDQSILEELLPYTKQGTFETTTKQEKLIDHVLMQLKSIKENFISNTSLSCYGDGDWDDTLQPANPELRKSMVSGWTTALTYETFDILGNILSEKYKGLGDEFKSLAESIKSDYRKYVIVDGVPAGFLLFEGENIKYIVHPLDDQTGVKYRLLPINRCLISGLFDKDEIEHYFGVIKEHLYHPDGVRLMDTTVKYNGGANTYFRRAEQSAYFGREVGLQYVHAHIRFIEAMAKVGYADEVWKGLLTINPINIQNVVPNADRSQSNCYFSSSDAAFNNRYEAMEQFEKIKTGDVRVKAGWRVYSSGPGIYLNQLISNALGIRIYRGKMEIDPVLPAELNGLNFKFGDYNYKYIITQNEGIKAIKLNGTQIKHQELDNKYRPGSALISIEDYKHLLTTDNIIEVVM